MDFKTLEDTILKSKDVSCSYKVKEILGHAVVICTIKDESGRSIQKIGEIAGTNCPTTEASKIAFEAAAKAYLGISDEITDNNNESKSSDSKVAEKKATETHDEPEKEVAEVEEVEAADKVKEAEESKSTEDAVNKETVIDSVESKPAIEDVFITIGKYAKQDPKPRASEVVANDESWANFIVEKMSNVNGQLREQVNALKYFLEN